MVAPHRSGNPVPIDASPRTPRPGAVHQLVFSAMDSRRWRKLAPGNYRAAGGGSCCEKSADANCWALIFPGTGSRKQLKTKGEHELGGLVLTLKPDPPFSGVLSWKKLIKFTAALRWASLARTSSPITSGVAIVDGSRQARLRDGRRGRCRTTCSTSTTTRCACRRVFPSRAPDGILFQWKTGARANSASSFDLNLAQPGTYRNRPG